MKKDKIVLFLIYLYGFYIFYFPELNSFIGIRSHLLLAGLFLLLVPVFIIIKKNKLLNINKQLFLLVIGILISILYFTIRATVANQELRIVQNSFILLQIIHISFLYLFVKTYGMKKDEIVRLPLNLGVIQSLICIGMIIFPSLKEIALDLYYNGRPENIFISANRIYGISSDFTFFTPTYHGILCTIAFVYAILKKWNYIIYIPFLLINILLNGRIGLVVFIVGVVISVLYLLLKGKSKSKVIAYMLFSIIALISILTIAKHIVPNTFNWIISGFNDTINFFLDRELSGNYTTLFETMLFTPPNIIFGEGFRVYAGNALEYGFNSSDIGYVNDLFMGGIVYVIILYLSIFKFIFTNGNNKNKTKEFIINKTISYSLFFMLLVANFKGECMRSGLVVLIIVFIKLALNDNDKVHEKGIAS